MRQRKLPPLICHCGESAVRRQTSVEGQRLDRAGQCDDTVHQRRRPHRAPPLRTPGGAGSGRADHRRTVQKPAPPFVPFRSPKSSSTHSGHGSRGVHQANKRSPHQTGASSDRTNWRRHVHWSRALQITRLAPSTIHDLRHTYASLARKSGADLRYVQKTMGHSTPTVTANIYSDLYATN